MDLKRMVSYLDDHFFLSTFSSVDSSQNGLQVEGNPNITTVTTCVDASIEAFKVAANLNSQFLIVHHGLFWGKSLLITGIHRERIAFLLEREISLYALHLPLDMHQKLGNNIQLANILNLKPIDNFGKYRNCDIGIATETEQPISLDTFVKQVEKCLNTQTRLLPFGPQEIKRVAIVSGSGASEIPRAAEEGFDLLLTGEGGHSVYYQAKENHINVLYAGHYATETPGVKALGEHLKKKFKLNHIFLDIPTGF